MAALQPLYTPENCKFAFQLRWGVTLHWREAVPESIWLEPLQDSLLKDEIKILSWQQPSDLMTQFALSTLPSHSPHFIIQRLKGRLQYAVRERSPRALVADALGLGRFIDDQASLPRQWSVASSKWTRFPKGA